MAATYRIGPSDFFTGGDLAADAQTVQDQIVELDAMIEGNEAVPSTFVDQWTAFEHQWRGFYDKFGGVVSNFFAALNDANRDDLIRYEAQLSAYQGEARQYGIGLIAPVDVSTGSKDTIGDQLGAQGLPSPWKLTAGLVVLAAAAIAVILVWKK